MEQSPESTEEYDAPAEVQEASSKTDMLQPMSWQATEMIHEKRGSMWYVVFGVVLLAMMLLAVFVFQSFTFAILLAVMAVAVVLLSLKSPNMITYAISPKGVYVADKLYDFSEFRSFGVVQDPRAASIILLPVKRFSPGVTLYFDEKDGEQIVDMLGARLPIQEVKPDSLEKFVRWLRL